MKNAIRENDGTPTNQTRIDVLKKALLKTLDNAQNVNVGLARFAKLHSPGVDLPVNVPILFPVSDIDQPLHQIRGEKDDTIPIVASIVRNSDDAEENQGTGEIFLTNPQLQVAKNANPRLIGLRFEMVEIPQGAKIVSANLELVSGTNASTPTDLVIKAENVDDALPFTNDNYNISNRTITTEAVSWNTVAPWQEGVTYTSPDLTPLVQSIVNRSGWCGGNGLAFIISANGENPLRNAKAYDDRPMFAPRLTVEYDSKAINSTGCLKQSWSGQISASTDDAEEKIGDEKYVYTHSSILELGIRNSTGTDRRLVGFRFKEIPIRPNAKIVKAHLILTSRNDGKDKPGTLSIVGEKSPNASSFSSELFNLSQRPKTSTEINWTPEETWELNKRYQSPDISAVIQEIVQQPEWQTYNELALFIEGSGRFDVTPFDGGPSSAALLRIQVEGHLGEMMTGRHRLKQIVQQMEILMSITPLVDGLYEASQYYLGKSVDYGKDRHGQKDYLVSHPGSYTGGVIEGITEDCVKTKPHNESCANEKISGNPVYVKPRTSPYQPNHIFLLTDGIPTANTSLENNKIYDLLAQLGGQTDCMTSYTLPSTNETLQVGVNENCGIDLADALAKNNILVHVVAFDLGKVWQAVYDVQDTNQLISEKDGNFFYKDGSEEPSERGGIITRAYEENVNLTKSHEKTLKFLCRLASQGEEGVGSVDWCSDRYFHQANTAEEIYHRLLPKILEEPSLAQFNLTTVGNGTINIAFAPPILEKGLIMPGNLDKNVNNCTTDCGTGCTETYRQGTTLELTALPAPGFIFTSWDGDCESTMNPFVVRTSQYNVNCTAQFEVLPNDTLANQVTDDIEAIELPIIEEPEKEPVVIVPENIVVEEPSTVVVIPPGPISQCPSTGLINKPCKNHGQVLTDATLETQASITRGKVAGNIINNGLISNVTVQSGALVSGGKITGYIINDGSLADFEFVGAKITGGTLSGTIYNNSEIGGFFQDVQLAPNTHIIGGTVAGTLQGDCEAPAQLENVTVKANTQLSCVNQLSEPTESEPLSSEITDSEELSSETIGSEELPSETTDSDELPKLESALALNAQAEITKSEAQFSGGISFEKGPFESSTTVTLADEVEIRGRIEIATSHRGQVAESLVVIAYQSLEDQKAVFLMLDENGEMLPWDFDLESLVAFQILDTQEEIVDMSIYQAQLPVTGMLNIYFGYRLTDGTVIYSPQTLDVMITE